MHQTAKDESVPAQDSRKVLTTVFISLLIDLLGFTVILPLFPSLLEFYQKNDKASHVLFSRTVCTSLCFMHQVDVLLWLE